MPNRASSEALAADPTLDKFILVFAREGYSPEGLKRFKEGRIGYRTCWPVPSPCGFIIRPMPSWNGLQTTACASTSAILVWPAVPADRRLDSFGRCGPLRSTDGA